MDNEQFCRLWVVFNGKVSQDKDLLNDLDSAIGDADHGTNMSRGLSKIIDDCESSNGESLRSNAKKIAMILLSTVGGASGALWGAGLLKASSVLPDSPSCSSVEFAHFIRAFVTSVQDRGKAMLGDKTMLDVFIPALEMFESGLEANLEYTLLVRDVAIKAKELSLNTRDLLAKRGRAAYLGERSIGHVDPGSWSSALWWESLSEAKMS